MTEPANPAPTPSPTPTGSEPESWINALPETLRGDKNLTKYESLEALASGHLNAIKRFGKDPNRLLEVPETPDDADGWNAVFAKLGRPEKPDGYQIDLGDKASDDDRAVAGAFAAEAHKAGLTPAQAQAMVGFWNGQTQASAEAITKANEAAAAATQAELKTAWGDKFPIYEKEIGKLLTDLAGDETAGEALIDELNASGLGNSPGLNKVLAKIVDLRAEGGLHGHGQNDQTGGGAQTPYQAQEALARLHGDGEKMKVLQDGNHPMHKTVMAERELLLKQAYPAQTT